MKKILIVILMVILSLAASSIVTSPIHAQNYPVPPSSPDVLWQPPYEGGGGTNPPVNIEVYGQNWGNLQVLPPSAVPPGIASSIINTYLVNRYGRILTDLYRNDSCYLVVSFNGPGYFYLWEYYPYGSTSYGHWLCYRWYCPRAGVWRIGPLTAEASDPAGEYTWKMWFLSGFSWSTRSLSFNFTKSYYPPDIPALTPDPVYAPVINSFSANKSSIDVGETTTLTWATTNTSGVTVSPDVGAVAVSGSTSITPASTTTYTLLAKGKSGSTASSTVTITVMPRIPPDISISQTTIQSNQSTLLSWNAPGAIQASITDIGNVNIKGSMQVLPDKTTTYTLTAIYNDGTTQFASVTVTVEQLPYLLWGLIALLAVAIILIVILIIRRRSKVHCEPATDIKTSSGTKPEATHSTDTLPATTPLLEAASARLVMPEGNEILLAGNARSFGRHDFAEFMPHNDISYISRQHINIWCENCQYYIEDRSSTNGTRINTQNIKGSGRHALADGDVIELAGKLHIVFKENINKEVQ